MSSLDYLDLCRLCLVKDRVSVPIFEGEGDVRQIFLKIAACLPVKVAREDKLPKKICDDCVYKVELFYQFWNTTVNAEKQLLQWLGEVNLEDKQNYVTDVLNPSVMKQEQQNSENRLDGTVMSGHQNNMSMGMMDNMGLGMPMIMSTNQQITSVPMDTSGSPVQSVQAVPGPSTQVSHEQLSQNQTNATTQEEDEESSEEDDNSEDECDGDEGLPVKEESEEDPGSNRTIEPTTFVNVSLACDEAGPSGLQQQKIAEMPEMAMPQTSDGDPKTGTNANDPLASTSALTTTPRLVPKPAHLQTYVVMPNNNHPFVFIPLNYLQVPPRRQGLSPAAMLTPKKIKKQPACPSRRKKKNNKKKQKNVTRVKREPPDHTKSSTSSSAQNKETKTVENSLSLKNENRIYNCDICDAWLKTKRSLIAHIDTHGLDGRLSPCIKTETKVESFLHRKNLARKRGKRFKCEVCRRKFKSSKNLENHVLLHSTTYICELCGMKLRSKYGLTKHLRTHTGEKSFLCTVCGKTFTTLSSQKIHFLTHMGKRPYVCDICGKGFTQRTPMMLHRRTQHPGSHPRPPPVKIAGLFNNVNKHEEEVKEEEVKPNEDEI